MLHLPATEKTPEVRFDPQQGLLELTGVAVHENADGFFGPILSALERYATAPAERTTIRVHMEYFNSSAAKYLLDMLRTLEDVHLAGRTKVRMSWVHAADDLDMQEAGNDYRMLLEFPVDLVVAAR
jgi:hypothetical protein